MSKSGTALTMASLALVLMGGGAEAKRRELPPGNGTANPSALVAAEIAFARMAREKGQWTAFRAFADDDAVMFVPQPVTARDWLARQKDPAAAMAWEPYEVWISCDGTLGVTRGGWSRPDGTAGVFMTVWQKQKKGDYRWVMDQGESLAKPLDKPDFLKASVARCAADPAPAIAVTPTPGSVRNGKSNDGTLAWDVVLAADCSRSISVRLYRGPDKGFETVLADEVPAPAVDAGQPSPHCVGGNGDARSLP